nr:phosphoribosyltransferase family protein [Aneurinibacillus terranovensis]
MRDPNRVGVRLFQRMINWIYPQPDSCLLCGMAVFRRGRLPCRLCLRCESMFTFLDKDAICEGCGRLWLHSQGMPGGSIDGSKNSICPDCCRRGKTYLTYSRSAATYNETMKELIARYKFRGDRKLAPILAAFLIYAWNKHYKTENKESKESKGICDKSHLPRIDLITYVPLHDSRLHERTFNQAEELARLLGAAVGVPVAGLLEKVRATEKQSHKNRQGRLHALDHTLRYRSDYADRAGTLADCTMSSENRISEAKNTRTIVIVDDIYTTGSTLNEAAYVLKHGIPEAKIYGLTVAR